MTPARPTKDFPVSWEEMHRTARALAWRLVDKGPWKGVVAVTRGGLIPSYVVARELDIKLIETVCVSTYEHQAKHTAEVLHKPEAAGDGAGWLVIDDLVDTGATFKIIRGILPKAHYACLYAKPAGVPSADTFITEVSQDTWIYFPWYMEAKYSEPIVNLRSSS